MKAKSYQQDEQQWSQLSLPFDFKLQCNQYHMSPKKSRVVPHEVTVRENRKNAQSSSKIANNATIFASSAFPMSMIDDILPFLSPQDLIFMTAIIICQKHLTN